MHSREELLADALVNGRVPTLIRDVVVSTYDSMLAGMTIDSELEPGEIRQLCGLSMLTRATVSMYRHGMWHHMPSAMGFERGPDELLYTAGGDRVIPILEDALSYGHINVKAITKTTRKGSLYDILVIDSMIRSHVDPRIAFGSCHPEEGTSIIGSISHVEAAMELAAGVPQLEIAFAVILGAMEAKFSPGLSMENVQD